MRRTPPQLFEPSNPFFEASDSQPESKDHVSEKKRRAPLPPSDRERPPDELCNPSVTVSKVHSVSPLGGIKTNLHCDEGSDGEKDDPCAARIAPKPPKRRGPQSEQIASKEKTIQMIHTKGTCDTTPPKHTKGPAPSKPNRTNVLAPLRDGRPEHAQSTAFFKENSQDTNILSSRHTVKEQRPRTYGSNPFDDDDEDGDGIHPADQDELCHVLNVGPKHLSGSEAQTPASTDGSSSSKSRSLKTVRAPPPPEDKENNPMSQSRNVDSKTKDVASSSARGVSRPSAHDGLTTSYTPKHPENTQETNAELLEMATRSLSPEWPWKTEATAEREVRVQTAAGPASVRVQTAASPVSPSRR